MAAAFYAAGFEPWDITMSDLLAGKSSLEEYRGIAFVGGFSYADVLDSAKGWAASIRFNQPLIQQFQNFYNRPDTFSLGVCNGCQLMALLGWVPGSDVGGSLGSGGDMSQPRFIHNESGRFECRFTSVSIGDSPAIMFKGMEGSTLGVWSAHVYPFNPNGSPLGIAALCSPDGRHLAMMPHPERCFMIMLENGVRSAGWNTLSKCGGSWQLSKPQVIVGLWFHPFSSVILSPGSLSSWPLDSHFFPSPIAAHTTSSKSQELFSSGCPNPPSLCASLCFHCPAYGCIAIISTASPLKHPLILPTIHGRGHKSTRIVLSFVFLLVPLAATGLFSPPAQRLAPRPATVVADFHRTDWRQDWQRLADCGISFGRNAMGARAAMYMVTDSSRPRPGAQSRSPVSSPPSTRAMALAGTAAAAAASGLHLPPFSYPSHRSLALANVFPWRRRGAPAAVRCAKRTGKRRYPSEKKRLDRRHKELLRQAAPEEGSAGREAGYWRLSKLAVPARDDPGKDFAGVSPPASPSCRQSTQVPCCFYAP
ncbi:hypothetical protein GUJ93_ZPchr0010g8824 [Zizania palustris]|uniref:Uncharacterized protein n=1 Tax=Zizania palustris TaxID=103762 RepID=A0A8J6BE82_ZIZPA|nr:hypothetical protein GUJ93_ZPchr0010g8824 [Zizania palustris]